MDIPITKNSAERATAATNKPLPVIDGVRAIACLTIIWYHINLITNRQYFWTRGIGNWATGIVFAGWSGVTLFFVLSGFLLFMPYAKAIVFNTAWPSAHRFYLRRIFRIWPGYYCSLAILILLAHPEYLNIGHWKQLLLFFTFFMDSTPATYQAINGPFWTLAIEWQYYLSLPLLAFGFALLLRYQKHFQIRFWLLLLCLVGMLIWGVVTRYWGRFLILHPDSVLLPQPFQKWLLFFIYGFSGKYSEDFAVGMMISACYVLAQQQPQHLLVTFCQRFSQYLWAVGLLWLFAVSIWPYTAMKDYLDPWIGPHNSLSDLVFALGFGLCLLALVFGSSELKRPLEWKPLRALGLLSYALYIWHLPILFFFQAWITPYTIGWHYKFVYGLYWLCVLALVIPFACAFYFCIERPWIRIGSRLTR